MQKEKNIMQTINRKFFPRRGVAAGSKWRICFRAGETGEELRQLKGIEFDNERDAVAEAELQNMTEDLRFYFNEFPEFYLRVGDVSDIWKEPKRAAPTGRSVIVYVVTNRTPTRIAPLFACGVGESGHARAIQFLDMVRQSRLWGYAPAPPRPETEPDDADDFEVSLWQNFATIEARVDEARDALTEAAAILEIARGKSLFKVNAVGMEHFVERLRDALKQLHLLSDGTDFVNHGGDFAAFLNSFGLKRFNDKFFDEHEREINFIDGYEKYCKDDQTPVTDEETAFLETLEKTFERDFDDEDEYFDSDDWEENDPRGRAVRKMERDAVLDTTERVEPTDDSPFAVSIDDVVDKRGGGRFIRRENFPNDDE